MIPLADQPHATIAELRFLGVVAIRLDCDRLLSALTGMILDRKR